MKKISMNSALSIAALSLKNNLKLLTGWGIGSFGVMFLYMILFPSVQDMAKVKMESMPKELLEFMGMSSFSDMGNFISYLGMIFGIVILVISVFASVYAGGLINKEEKQKTIEFLYGLSVSRDEIYLGKSIAAYAGVMGVLLMAAISSLICGFINGGETFVLTDAVQIFKITGFSAFIFTGVSLFIAGLTAKVSAGAVSSGVVFLCYVLGYLSTLLGDKAQWLKYFSPFETLSSTQALAGEDILIKILIYFVIAAALTALGGVFYKRRDFTV